MLNCNKLWQVQNKLSCKNMDQKIFEKLIEIAVSKFHYSHVHSLTALNQSVTELFDLDSLAFMEFISTIEEEFNIHFRDDISFEEINNLSNLVHEIENSKKNVSNISRAQNW
jgi:acyl carrier protein